VAQWWALELSGFVEGGEFPYQLSDYQFLKKNSASIEL
jgi:hypothetical protein